MPNTTFEHQTGKADPAVEAKAAGLRYVSDARPGIRRKRSGKSFTYTAPDGSKVTDARTLERIRSLVIPPAWTDVWICTMANGHLQATGRDARGRKQYRYHSRWREGRDETKYGRMPAFGAALPTIRAAVERDIARHGLPREKVLATVVRLLDTTFIRVGNEEYARTNHHYGLTTLHNRHAEVKGGTVRFRFRGKSGVQHEVELNDRRVAGVIRKCRDLPGYELFEYQDDDGAIRSIDASDVNAYLKEISGEDFTAKDFRTWAGTVLCALSLQAIGASETETEAKRNVAQAIKEVAERLGNTPAVCRKCYIHPTVLEAYTEGALKNLESGMKQVTDHALRAEEAAVLKFLKKRMKEA